ncbi:metallo-endopeptidase [Stachybotrys elegans]|uniref:Neutral protease 2 n=1 Tax=Stachybotrys elegans TaxID=80388 RepID=A0A8K0SJZ6_9HYPO|nr:metallo-endopeptidase [Stachybotrys elegans]
MKFIAGLAALVSVALAAPSRAPTPLDIKLEMVGNSAVKATVTNVGKNSLKLLKTGTFLDTSAVERVTVTSDAKKLDFDGIKLRIAIDSLTEDSFQRIGASESIEVTFDVAEVYDLSQGGIFKIASSGVISAAEEDDTKLVKSVPYWSNEVEADVNGEEASFARIAFHQKRVIVQDCTGTRGTVTTTALSNCASLARAASTAASSGSAAKIEEYFKSSSSSTRSTVSTVFSRVASECGSRTSGMSRYYCSDPYGACSSNVLAYTVPSASITAYCNLYFNNLPALTRTCHAQDQAGTNVHEMTHLTQIRGTSDYSGYGYNYVRSLTAAQNLNHADTYALFANAIYAGC